MKWHVTEYKEGPVAPRIRLRNFLRMFEMDLGSYEQSIEDEGLVQRLRSWHKDGCILRASMKRAEKVAHEELQEVQRLRREWFAAQGKAPLVQDDPVMHLPAIKTAQERVEMAQAKLSLAMKQLEDVKDRMQA